MKRIFFRPEWTTGRYDSKKHVAIFYNLIEGMSYFFEDESADVIGKILSVVRNGHFTSEEITEDTNIPIEILLPFLEELENLNLLTKEHPTKEGINKYRISVAEWKKNNPIKLVKSTKEKLPFEESTAEMEYTNRVGGITNVMLELTYNCSEKCIHCYNIGASHTEEQKSHRDSVKGLNFEDYTNIIDELYDHGLFRVTLSGGDPFSNPYAWDIIQYLYDKEIAFDILTNGQRLLDSDVNPLVVALFAYLHDSCRLNDAEDINHGKRAAEWIEELRETYLKDIPAEDIELLKKACRLHTTVHKTGNPTIDACFDADRLDLWRVDIIPDPERLATEKGKQIARSTDYELPEKTNAYFVRKNGENIA